MKTLFPPNLNWAIFVLIAIVIRVFFLGMNWTSYFAVLLSLHQFFLLFNSINYVIPVRYLLGAFMCVQFFIGPAMAYSGLDAYQYFQYRMKISETAYFAYAIPAVVSFIIGMHVMAGKLDGEILAEEKIILFAQKNPSIAYKFIGIGFLASIISSFFSSEAAFVFYLLGSFKFIGLFLLILGGKQIKVLPLILVIGSIISTSLGEGMFHDLLTWIIFTGAVVAIKYKFRFNTKIIACILFIALALVIQVLKSSYRTAKGEVGETGGIETFSKVYEKQNEDKGIFSFEQLAPSNVRINQGFIITNIMATIPSRIPFSNGAEMYQILEAAILPRFLAPNKLMAGNREIFMKYTGIQIRQGTSMGLSSLGDAYINYGIYGGCAFMFLLGLLYSYVLKVFYKHSREYPILILFTALVFYYPIRPDCELQTILGHLFKSCFLIACMIFYFKRTFRLNNAALTRY